ncbi:MAG TPA: hypothetical protein VF727_04860 [Allosphingosinicella sp.]
MSEVKAFSPRLVVSLIAAGVVAFGLFLVLMAYAGDYRSGHDGRAHALSPAANGFAGLVRLIELSGGEPRMIRSEEALDTGDLVVATLEPGMSKEALAGFLKRRHARPTLLVLPKWAVLGDPQKPGWVRGAGWQSPRAYREALEAAGKVEVRLARPARREAAGAEELDGLTVPLPMPVQTLAGPELKPLLTAPGGEVVLARLGALFVLAEPDLLNNKGLAKKESARAALALLDALNAADGETVSFDLTLNGFAQRPNLLKLMFQPPFLTLTIAIFLAALLAGLHGAWRFGPEQAEPRAIAFGKAALVENSAALFRIARREHRTGGAYAELIREAAARESGAHLALGEHELDAYLDRVSPPSGPTFSDLARRAAAAANPSELLAAARALFQWKKDLIK